MKTYCASPEYAKDLQATLRNRSRLAANRNLLFWYQELYKDQFRNLGDLKGLAILEIGSGVSPLARFYPAVQTSDVLELDYVDLVFDCHRIDEFEPISDNSLDVITLTNVLHHLKSPLDFLAKAAKKLKPGGTLVATEPYFSVLSNDALPWLIFNRPEWRRQIEQHFYLEQPVFRPYTGLSYFATGGISHRIPIPHVFYRCFFAADLWLSRVAPKVMASFFTITLFRKESPCAPRT